jgi:hypothetical protein
MQPNEVHGKWPHVKVAMLFMACAFGVACTGTVADVGNAKNKQPGGIGGATPGSAGSTGGNRGSGGTAGAAALPPPEVGSMPLTRLTRTQYNNVIKDLFNAGPHPADVFTPEIAGSSGFLTPGLVNELEVQQFQSGADEVVQSLGANVLKLVPCDTAKVSEAACAEQFVKDFGKRIYRRPVAAAEVQLHTAFYKDQLRGTLALSHAEAMGVLLNAMLQSPPFLYRWERGPAAPSGTPTNVPLTSWEIASRLSFFFWNSMPDAELFTAAESDSLRDPATVKVQAQRLLASPRADEMIKQFHREWLWVRTSWPKDARYTLWVGGIDHAAVTDVLSTALHVFRQGDGKWNTLMTTPVAYLNNSLAKVYGVAGITNTDAFKGQLAMLNATERPGLLTRVGILAAGANAIEADPIKRGKLIRMQLLCQSLAAPPANVPILPVDPTLSIRARHVAHVQNPACAGCHALTDGIGFGLSAYDGIGAYVPTEKSVAVDTSGVVNEIDGTNKNFANAAELNSILIKSEEVKTCLTRQWVRFALGRELESADQAAFDKLYQDFTTSDYDLRELLVSVATSKPFLNRAPAAGEVKQ